MTTKKTSRSSGHQPRIVHNKKDLKKGTNYVQHHTKHGYSYEAVVVDSKGMKHPMKLTPSGYIDPADVYNYIMEAQRGRSKEGMEIDLKIQAKKIFPSKPTPQQLVTYSNNPNRYDIEGFDAPKGTATVKRSKPKISRLKDNDTKAAEPKRPRSKETIDDVFSDSDEAMWRRYTSYNKRTKKTAGGKNGNKRKAGTKKHC